MGNRNRLIEFVKTWCENDCHGYSQDNRWGPDCDCSSLMYMAAREAGYEVPNSGTRYTGTMRNHFSNAGFSVKQFNGDLWSYPSGTIYLSESGGHTEMDLGDCLGGAHIDENGGVAGPKSGDQTGSEVSFCNKYDFPWEWAIVPPESSRALDNPRYRLKTRESGWLPWMKGLVSEDGSADDYAGTRGNRAIGLDVDWGKASGWFRLWTEDHPQGLTKNDKGDDSPILALAIYYSTPDPDLTGWFRAKYRVSAIGSDYFKWEFDDEDSFAGDGKTPIDRLQFILSR